jgi:hypothetical protein
MSPSPTLNLIAARRGLFARQGSIVRTWRRRGTKTHGPYYRLAYRDGGRQRSIYLGRDGPLVAQARQALAALQNPLRQRRLANRLYRHCRATIRLNNARLDSMLRPMGLRGLQIRGGRWGTGWNGTCAPAVLMRCGGARSTSTVFLRKSTVAKRSRRLIVHLARAVIGFWQRRD